MYPDFLLMLATCSFLRKITTGQGPEERNQTRETGFDISVSAELHLLHSVLRGMWWAVLRGMWWASPCYALPPGCSRCLIPGCFPPESSQATWAYVGTEEVCPVNGLLIQALEWCLAKVVPALQ